jgi:hypothetical protein
MLILAEKEEAKKYDPSWGQKWSWDESQLILLW